MNERSVNKVKDSGTVTIPRSFLDRHGIVPGRDKVIVWDDGEKCTIRPIGK